MTKQEQVWAAMTNKGQTKRQLAAICGLSLMEVESSLRNMRLISLVAVTGFSHRCTWFRVPGAVLPGDGRGQSPRSRANLRKEAKEASPSLPLVTWASLLEIVTGKGK